MLRALTMALPVLAVAVLTSATAAQAVTADWGRLDSLATGRTIAGPAGWLNWCMGAPGRCAPLSGTREVRATPALLSLLASVQDAINHAIIPSAEPAGQDLWQTGAARGDCEDFALAKQARLRGAGLPDGAIRLATARLPRGELHAVLTVTTDHGTLVLDNLQARVVPFAALPYAWLRVQGVDSTLRWQELAGFPAANGRPAPWDMERQAAGAETTAGVDQ